MKWGSSMVGAVGEVEIFTTLDWLGVIVLKVYNMQDVLVSRGQITYAQRLGETFGNMSSLSLIDPQLLGTLMTLFLSLSGQL